MPPPFLHTEIDHLGAAAVIPDYHLPGFLSSLFEVHPFLDLDKMCRAVTTREQQGLPPPVVLPVTKSCPVCKNSYRPIGVGMFCSECGVRKHDPAPHLTLGSSWPTTGPQAVKVNEIKVNIYMSKFY
jgi:hypothetical protein